MVNPINTLPAAAALLAAASGDGSSGAVVENYSPHQYSVSDEPSPSSSGQPAWLQQPWRPSGTLFRGSGTTSRPHSASSSVSTPISGATTLAGGGGAAANQGSRPNSAHSNRLGLNVNLPDTLLRQIELRAKDRPARSKTATQQQQRMPWRPPGLNDKVPATTRGERTQWTPDMHMEWRMASSGYDHPHDHPEVNSAAHAVPTDTESFLPERAAVGDEEYDEYYLRDTDPSSIPTPASLYTDGYTGERFEGEGEEGEYPVFASEFPVQVRAPGGVRAGTYLIQRGGARRPTSGAVVVMVLDSRFMEQHQFVVEYLNSSSNNGTLSVPRHSHRNLDLALAVVQQQLNQFLLDVVLEVEVVLVPVL